MTRQDREDLDAVLAQLDEDAKYRLRRLIQSCALDAGREQRAHTRKQLRALWSGGAFTLSDALKCVRYPKKGVRP